jgi:hypothetical protein
MSADAAAVSRGQFAGKERVYHRRRHRDRARVRPVPRGGGLLRTSRSAAGVQVEPRPGPRSWRGQDRP